MYVNMHRGRKEAFTYSYIFDVLNTQVVAAVKSIAHNMSRDNSNESIANKP